MDCSHFCCIFHRDCFQFPWNSLKVNCIIKWLLLPLLLSACQEGTQIMGKYGTIVSFQVNLCKDYTDDVEYMNTFFKCINVSVVTAGWTLSCLTIIISSHHIFFRTDHSSYILPSTLLWKLSKASASNAEASLWHFFTSPPLHPSFTNMNCMWPGRCWRAERHSSTVSITAWNTGVTRLSHFSQPQDKALTPQLRLVPFSSIESKVTVP